MLIGRDCGDCCNDAILVEAGQNSHHDYAALVAEESPAEMCQMIEDDEADDADDEMDGADGQQQPHPSPDGSQMRLVNRVEVLQTLDRHLHDVLFQF